MFRFKPRARRDQKGFTIIELMVVAPIVILTIGAFVTVIVSMTGDVLAARAANSTLFNVQDSLNRIEQDIKLSSSFLATSGATANNNFALTTGQGFDDGTAIFQNASVSNGNMLILNSIATTGNPIATSSAYVYAIDPLNACGTAKVIQNKPQSMNIIYFVKAGTLWRRTVMQSNYTNTSTGWCNSPWQIPSCTPGYVAAFCKTQDIQLVTGLGTTGFTVQYFNGSSASIENATASNTATSDTNRAAALLSSTTASVSLTSAQTVAGRSISQAATMRATRLDVNASANVIPVVATTPSAPVVTATTSTPSTSTFTWSQISGAATYSVDYNINGGSWNTGFTNQNLTTYTPPSCATASSPCTNHNNIVNVRVSATNTAGTSSYGTGSVTIPLWVTPLMQNNWSNYNSAGYSGSAYTTVGYTKTSSGLVALKGLVQGGSGTLFTLPVGYRPTEQLVFLIVAGSDTTAGRLDILTDGSVNLVVGTNGYVSLSSVRFMPSDSIGPTFTNITLLNSWVYYGSPFAQPAYAVDSAGRVQIKGFIKNGTATGGTSLWTIPTTPSNLAPSASDIIAVSSNNSIGSMNVALSTTTLQFFTGSNVSFSMQGMYYPTGTATWTNLTLQNSWVWVGGNPPTLGTTKGTDGIVLIRGTIKSGTITSGTVIANLPAGYRPLQEIIVPANANGIFGRFDIYPNGNIVCISVNNSAQLSLDGISFPAEQ